MGKKILLLMMLLAVIQMTGCRESPTVTSKAVITKHNDDDCIIYGILFDDDRWRDSDVYDGWSGSNFAFIYLESNYENIGECSAKNYFIKYVNDNVTCVGIKNASYCPGSECNTKEKIKTDKLKEMKGGCK